MKKVLKVIGIVFASIYAVVAITLTVFLLNYNKYNITEINNKSLIIVRDEELKPDFQKGDLVIVNRDANRDIKVGDKIFFYDNYKEIISVNLATVLEKEKITNNETTFIVDGDYAVSSEYVIGTARTSKSYSKLGTILGLLEARFGFLFMIIFPILILFVYEIYVVIKELKDSKHDDLEEEVKKVKKNNKQKVEEVESKEENKEEVEPKEEVKEENNEE